MNIQQTIVKAHYVATEQQVEQLAGAQYTASTEVEGYNNTYLRVLVVDVQSQVGTKKRGRTLAIDAQLTVVTQSHDKFYPAVLRGVTTPDVDSDVLDHETGKPLLPPERSRRALERNRRSTFARTAKTTLVNFVKGGGDVRTLDAETVTKARLRAAIAPPEPATRLARQIQRAQGALIRAIDRQARGDPGGAHEALETAIEALQAHLDAMPTVKDLGATTTIVGAPRGRGDRGPARTRVGTPQLHKGA